MTNDPVVPHNSAAEQAVIGGMMLNTDEERRHSVMALLKPESFYLRTHQMIYRRLIDLARSDKPTDLITLGELLESNGELEVVGGFAYLAEMARVPMAANTLAYARIVREKAVLRYTLEKLYACIEIVGASNSASVESRLSSVQQMITAVVDHATTGKRGGLKAAADVVGEWVDELDRRFSDPAGAAGFTLGIEGLDTLMAPKQVLRGALVVIGARPKMGKTATYNKIATHFALNHRLPTLVFSLEMTDRGIIERMIAQEAAISSNLFYNGVYDDVEMARAMAKATELAESNLMIDSTPGVSLAHIVAECRKVKRQRGNIGLVAVDYLTLMKGEEAERRDISYGAITTGLKNLAKELDCVVLLLTQLNRKLEERADKRPWPADSKDTGQIEQDCDVWIGLYRDAVYNEQADKTLMELILRLNREGPSGTAYAQMVDGYIRDIPPDEAQRLASVGQEKSRRYGKKKPIEEF
ncbi:MULTISPECIES: replicative DNA helicase [Brenneria]|uniref:DNA 5'-3' helicase n=1 Tax=Brenneria nigrifluens DSM 30175 = ATCC 13028 TaxID=1121120 RepID=A0A2U1UUR5_9GAMM|nr:MULTISPECIES: DnaB-like helicase C-terminal domain-containing protein [Brenneria]EHD22094.1 DnaB domain protein helicase domain protein [Brenneria sp. EniD312]PWC25424.1 helicase DnaB [Brenneria nigrifluens] [Brenneria nigrifluens DSM 30175 = ATCC 13028]QCR05174.1 helicase DnaB [Brenneria nigrifluens] [Brenneria nigrifluens DSM 30175 = ATCC 13028]